MKKVSCLIVFLLIVTTVSGSVHSREDRDVLYQTSTLGALLQGAYEGTVSFEELEEHGNFGLGTLNDLDGEMVGFGGDFYQVTVDGKTHVIPGSASTPFAVVTFFESDINLTVEDSLDYEGLKGLIDDNLPTKNVFYAIKIQGNFDYVKTRSVPAQEKPYPPLEEVVENEARFEFLDVEGTLAGFRCPSYVKGINAAGYHLHFLTDDKESGGHLLEVRTENGKIEIDDTDKLFLALPDRAEFYQKDLSSGNDS